MQEGQNETWNHAQEAREHVSAAIDKLAQLYGTLVLDYDTEDYNLVTPIQEMREDLRGAAAHLTDIMVMHKTEPNKDQGQ